MATPPVDPALESFLMQAEVAPTPARAQRATYPQPQPVLRPAGGSIVHRFDPANVFWSSVALTTGMLFVVLIFGSLALGALRLLALR